jgi:hypothetical protein
MIRFANIDEASLAEPHGRHKICLINLHLGLEHARWKNCLSVLPPLIFIVALCDDPFRLTLWDQIIEKEEQLSEF